MMHCNIIKDILPLYVDDVVSQETKSMIESHLTQCNNCTKELDKLRQAVRPELKKDIAPFRKIKKKLIRKQIITIVISFISAVAVLSGAFYAIVIHEQPLSYNAIGNHLRFIETTDQQLAIGLYGTSFSGFKYREQELSYDLGTNTHEIRLIFYFAGTVWTRFISKKNEPVDRWVYFAKDPEFYDNIGGDPIERKTVVTEVCYQVFDPDKTPVDKADTLPITGRKVVWTKK